MKLTEAPSMSWLRLSTGQERVLLLAWTADSISVRGRDLGAAGKLVRRGLLRFVRPIDGGLRGEFAITEDARAYPPTGLKALTVQHVGCLEISARPRSPRRQP